MPIVQCKDMPRCGNYSRYLQSPDRSLYRCTCGHGPCDHCCRQLVFNNVVRTLSAVFLVDDLHFVTLIAHCALEKLTVALRFAKVVNEFIRTMHVLWNMSLTNELDVF
jgi:hypothetical protein